MRFKNELERNITIKLGYANAKIFKAVEGAEAGPGNFRQAWGGGGPVGRDARLVWVLVGRYGDFGMCVFLTHATIEVAVFV